VEESLQKQFNLISDLLADAIPFVRVAAIQLVGHVLTLFSDFVPQRVKQGYQAMLAHSLAFDSRSDDVRVAAIKALHKMLEVPLMQLQLRDLLPSLANVIFDNSERVRYAMVRFLESIKRIKGLKFYRVVSLENLLLQLECENRSKISKLLSKLLLETYFPHATKKTSELVIRCIACARSNEKAALSLYEQIATQVCTCFSSISLLFVFSSPFRFRFVFLFVFLSLGSVWPHRQVYHAPLVLLPLRVDCCETHRA
jgi:hypothetical protein